jgi:hypothetical protein
MVSQGKLKVCRISTHENPDDMMTKSISIAKFELCSSIVGIAVYLKWLFSAERVFFVIQVKVYCSCYMKEFVSRWIELVI